ncbi:MAG TPA: cytosine permease [Rhodanobacteraceae bacterium]
MALTPDERVFGWRDHASLWFSLGVGLLVMQAGAFLVPAASPRTAALAVLAGSVLGAALLGWVAYIGCGTGLSSAGLMLRTYGQSFARLPVLLNILQLAGWTTFELVIMRDATLTIARHATGLPLHGAGGVIVTTAAWGGVLVLMLSRPMTGLVRRVIGKIGVPLVVLSLVWLTWQFGVHLANGTASGFWTRPGAGHMPFFAALDLVIAMPVSWFPVVADYARHGRLRGDHGPARAFSGTWLGYALANIWCYGLGVAIAHSAAPGTPMLGALLLAQGGLVALGVILVDDLGNLYGAAYASAASANSVYARWGVRRWSLVLACTCTVLAVLLPMHGLEPFLLWLSSIFVPLYGVILARLGTRRPDALPAPHRVDVVAALIWLGGIALYHALPYFAPAIGSSLPTLAATFALGWATRAR